MRTARRILLSAAVLATALPANAIAQATDPIMGTWVLNVAKSKYEPGPPTQSQTRTYTPAPNGYKFVADGVNAAGAKTHSEFTVAFDGKYHKMTGNPNSDAIMVRQVDANTVESTQKKGAKVVIMTTRTLSADGKTLTSISRGTNAQGKSYANIEVFDKK